jgi:hypothetical protein
VIGFPGLSRLRNGWGSELIHYSVHLISQHFTVHRIRQDGRGAERTRVCIALRLSFPPFWNTRCNERFLVGEWSQLHFEPQVAGLGKVPSHMYMSFTSLSVPTSIPSSAIRALFPPLSAALLLPWTTSSHHTEKVVRSSSTPASIHHDAFQTHPPAALCELPRSLQHRPRFAYGLVVSQACPRCRT